MSTYLFVLLLATFLTGLIAEKDRFDNHKVYSVHIDTLDQLQLFQNLGENVNGFLLWNYPVLGDTVDIMVAPHKLSEFRELTDLYNLKISLKIKNVQRLPKIPAFCYLHNKKFNTNSIIDAESPAVRSKKFGWTAYNNYTEIYKWLDELLETYPTILKGHVVGSTFQGREIRAVKLSYKEVHK